ncbi:putative gibberellin 3-beta-dioxygenase [Helianthus annuus]|uniref:Gibberellin 3-beta-dioxygenase n=1 Tax=Helianthus annuus TaxID=4232 RepID=A0A251V259_HELAN|nr:gibberellin 20-oxidase-like protein [Helianthus annuus]KAF5811620.1 putative gibberellin 3-beta-dioxygenase [Helianthus annuus]KAJ0590443.1 putative gibberellin 3-beta-dioxygenase [Helianthus annuus]KAJ0928365.1 putative gibberellin 3-beta-dioxygenase [Helianthus annuus]KAJ0932726.1 putative gibberellin 3-beta-dioxygenase [Helianthus annuus]
MVSSSAFETTLNLPSLDLSKPLQPSSMSSLSEACHQWGFFNIVNHGISKDLFENIKSFSNQLFDLPSEVKLKLGPSSSIKTYTPQFIASPYFESFRVSGPDFHSSAQGSVDVVFNNNIRHEFGEILEEYGKKMTELAKKIMKIALMVLGDGFDTRFYDLDFKNCHGYLRINRYSPPTNLEDMKTIEGLGMHTDMSCITIVYQDETGGLQVKSKQEGRWMDIAPSEGTLVVNIGDLLQAWSNDKLISSEHRVVLKKPVNRLSIAFFWCFEDEKVILAPNEVAGNEDMRLYKPFVCLDYLKFRESNEEGKFEKVGFTVKDFVAHNAKNELCTKVQAVTQ